MNKKVIIIGAGLGGLSAAIHARLLGWDAVVLEKGSHAGGKAAGMAVDGWEIDPGPSLLILPEAFEELFAAAGRRMADYLAFERLDPFVRLFPEGGDPLDLPADEEACIAALSSRAPGDEKGLRRLLAKLDRLVPGVERTMLGGPLHHPWQLLNPSLVRTGIEFDVSKTYRDLVDSFFSSELMRSFFYGLPSYTGQSWHTKSASAFLIPYIMFRKGVWAAKGGIAAIPRALERLARELGVEFVWDVNVTECYAADGRLESVVDEEGRPHRADAFISNMDRITLGILLGRPEPLRPSFSYFTAQWGLRKETPLALHHGFLVPHGAAQGFEDLYSRRRPPSRPVLYVNSGAAPQGRSCLKAMTAVPALEHDLDWVEESPRLLQHIREELDRSGLGFRDDEVVFERIQTPRLFAEEHGNWSGSLFGPDETERLWGLLPLRCRDEKLSNLFYAGATVQPGAGMPMAVLSGRFAASLLPPLRGR